MKNKFKIGDVVKHNKHLYIVYSRTEERHFNSENLDPIVDYRYHAMSVDGGFGIIRWEENFEKPTEEEIELNLENIIKTKSKIQEDERVFSAGESQ